MSRRHYVNNSVVTTTVGSLGTGTASVTVASATSFPASFPWAAVINAGQANAEEVLVTGAAGAVLTITRAYDGAAAQTHVNGETFTHVATAADFDEANSHINTATAVHGLAGSVVGTSDTQTLTNKTLTTPMISSPNVTGTATVAALHVSGASQLDGAATVGGTVTAGKFAGDGVAPVGSVTMFAGTVVPTGWLSCDGTAVNRTTYAALFTAVGTTYGVGDGSTTFNLPNMASNFPRGKTVTPGETGGSSTHHHTLSDAGQALINLGAPGASLLSERRVGSAAWTATEGVALSNIIAAGSTAGGTGAALLGNTDDATSIVPPYVSFDFIIKT